jgi:hypothetical protein
MPPLSLGPPRCYSDQVRVLVLALVLAVGSVGPSVCEAACSLETAAQKHHEVAPPSAGDLRIGTAALVGAGDHHCLRPVLFESSPPPHSSPPFTALRI